MKPLILVTGGNGRFTKILKKNKKLNLKFLNKKDLNILNQNYIEKCFAKLKPKIVFLCAGLSKAIKIHEVNISKSIDLNIIGTANMGKVCEKYKDIKKIISSILVN